MTVEEMLTFGGEITAMPILDRRTPDEIMDDLSAARSSSTARRWWPYANASATGTCAAAIRDTDRLIISAVNARETGFWMRVRRGEAAGRQVCRFLREENDFEIAPFDEVPAARAALAECAATDVKRCLRAHSPLPRNTVGAPGAVGRSPETPNH